MLVITSDIMATEESKLIVYVWRHLSKDGEFSALHLNDFLMSLDLNHTLNEIRIYSQYILNCVQAETLSFSLIIFKIGMNRMTS